MRPPIIIFHHAVFYLGDPLRLSESSLRIGLEQMQMLQDSELLDAAAELHVGLNGGPESEMLAEIVFPEKAKIRYHGTSSRSENLTLVMIEERMRTIQGEAYVLYLHQKGSSHAHGSDYGNFDGRWRNRMMRHLVSDWRQCIQDLKTYEAVGSHWRTGQGYDHSQHYFAGNMWFARASFLKTLPSIYKRERIKTSGITSLESRYESEIWIGNGKIPHIKNYYSGELGT